jgi:ABC-2 type transport system permease protein
MTAEKRYSLSDKTISLLKSLDNEIVVKIYLDGDDLPVGFKRMRRALNDILEVFDSYANKGIDFWYINPSLITDEKAKKGLYFDLYKKGLMPIVSDEVSEEGKSSQKMVFPGIIIMYNDSSIGVDLLVRNEKYKIDSEENINSSIQSLEYQITNAIRKLKQTSKPEVAFIEGHGELDEYQSMYFSSILSEYYMVKRGSINETPGILDSFKAIIIAKPIGKFSENDKLVIDQYIMKGGKVLWLLEGARIDKDSLLMNSNNAAMPMDNNLGDLLFKYGIRVNPGILQDARCSAIGTVKKNMNSKPVIELKAFPYYPYFISENTHEINKYVNPIKFEFASTIDTVGSSQKVKKTVLLKSSEYAKFDYAPIQVSLDNLTQEVDVRNMKEKNLPVAVLLEGVFNSNYKDRMFESFKIPNNQIINESKPTKMVVVSDGDFAKSDIDYYGKPIPMGYDKDLKFLYKGNSEFLLNAVNYLCDDEGFMSVRLREIKMRQLNKDKVRSEKLYWETINTAVPVIIIVLFAVLAWYIRKRKYTRNW